VLRHLQINKSKAVLPLANCIAQPLKKQPLTLTLVTLALVTLCYVTQMNRSYLCRVTPYGGPCHCHWVRVNQRLRFQPIVFRFPLPRSAENVYVNLPGPPAIATVACDFEVKFTKVNNLTKYWIGISKPF
jgi:hypothetical protein